MKQNKPVPSFPVDALRTYLCFTRRAWKSNCLTDELDEQQKYQFWVFLCTSKKLDLILRFF